MFVKCHFTLDWACIHFACAVGLSRSTMAVPSKAVGLSTSDSREEEASPTSLFLNGVGDRLSWAILKWQSGKWMWKFVYPIQYYNNNVPHYINEFGNKIKEPIKMVPIQKN